MNVQFIENQGKPEWAVIPYEAYLHLLEEAEFKADMMLLQEALADKEDEFVPATVVDRILDGENSIRVWREYRGLTRPQLANRAGISHAYLSQLEAGKRSASQKILVALATALNLTAEDLTIACVARNTEEVGEVA